MSFTSITVFPSYIISYLVMFLSPVYLSRICICCKFVVTEVVIDS